MKVLILTKRNYMGKDLLDDRFGRFREIPLELARLGHEVQGLCLSYSQRSEGEIFDCPADARAGVTWRAINLIKGPVPALRRYLRVAQHVVNELRPDIIWAGSDAYQAIFAARLARQCKTQFIVDLYDNFESYLGTAIPGILPLFKRAIRAADGVTCVSRQLADYVHRHYRCQAPSAVLENAIRSEWFRPLDRIAARKQLGLPETATIIGTAGALHKTRGTETLYRGYELLAAADANLHIAIAGPRGRNDKLPTGERVHDFGQLAQDLVPIFLNALDVAVVCNRDNIFSRFNFPQKAREILGCGIPIVAASVGTMKHLLAANPECLYTPDDPISLSQALRRQIRRPSEFNEPIPSWADMAVQLEDFFRTVRQKQSIYRQ